MGGNAFALEGLPTPRMTPQEYRHIMQHVQARLRPYFALIKTPIEAPEKIDHGDIDILAVASTAISPSGATIATALEAKLSKANGSTTIFAMPWPKDLNETRSSSSADKSETENINSAMRTTPLIQPTEPEVENRTIATTRYVQVDVHICKDIEDLKYIVFLQSHGDLMNMVGGIIRRFGLTCSSSGLYIRVSELEPFNKNKARVKILDKPEEILSYLGLDAERFWQPFTSLEECMAYVATCRFHDPERGKNDDEKKLELNADDRARVKKRPMFRYWVETYLPSHRNDSAGTSSQMTRADVIDEAKQLFGENFATTFEKQKSEGLKEAAQQKLWVNIRKEIEVENPKLTYAMKGLKREILTIPEDKSILSDVQKDYLEGLYDRVKDWSIANWEEVANRQESLDIEKSTQKLLTELENEGPMGRLATKDGNNAVPRNNDSFSARTGRMT